MCRALHSQALYVVSWCLSTDITVLYIVIWLNSRALQWGSVHQRVSPYTEHCKTWTDVHASNTILTCDLNDSNDHYIPSCVATFHYFLCCSQSGYVCMMFYRRDGHVIEVQTGMVCLLFY